MDDNVYHKLTICFTGLLAVDNPKNVRTFQQAKKLFNQYQVTASIDSSKWESMSSHWTKLALKQEKISRGCDLKNLKEYEVRYHAEEEPLPKALYFTNCLESGKSSTLLCFNDPENKKTEELSIFITHPGPYTNYSNIPEVVICYILDFITAPLQLLLILGLLLVWK